ncbi:hypothetical protein Tco_0312983 [Tanacetum coccineum]
MGRGTWYYSLGVFLEIVDVFVRSEFGISSWRGSRVDGRSYLLSGEIAGSEANRIIRDSKLREFSFYLVPLSYGSVDVAELQGEGLVRMVTCCEKPLYCLVGRKDDVAKTVFRMSNRHVKVYGYAFWVKQCTSGFHGVNEPGGVRVAREDDHGVTEGIEDVREVFQRRRSGARRKISRCGRNQMGNEPILALPEGADDFVVYYDARSKDLEAWFFPIMLEALSERDRRWMKLFSEYGFKAKYHLRKANVVVESWSRRKSEAKNEF